LQCMRNSNARSRRVRGARSLARRAAKFAVGVQMKLLPNQTDKRSLCLIGEEAAAVLVRNDFRGLADRFGYALAYGREPALAIEADCLKAKSVGRIEDQRNGQPITVKFFDPNSTNLIAVVECIVSLGGGAAVLLELIVTARREDRHITLENISDIT
jgi:hypothetical protein